MRYSEFPEDKNHQLNEGRHLRASNANGNFYSYNTTPSSVLEIIALEEGTADPDMTGCPDGTIVIWYEV